MNKYACVLTFPLFCLMCNSSYGQEETLKKTEKKNTFIINTGSSKFYDRNVYGYQKSKLFAITTFTYERHITPRFSVAATYGRRFLFFGQEGKGVIEYRIPNVLTNFNSEGDTMLWERNRYSYADIKAGYCLLEKKGFQLKAYVGISSTWGKNRYMDFVWINPEPPSDALFYSHTETEFNLGGLIALSCAYSFWKDRLQAGLFADLRHYPSLNSTQRDIGLQLGFSF